jgi:hypothetical protein
MRRRRIRLTAFILTFGIIDLILALLFTLSYRVTADDSRDA